MAVLFPLMLVPLMIWIAVWGYLWTLDNKVKRLEQMHGSTTQDEDENWPPAPQTEAVRKNNN